MSKRVHADAHAKSSREPLLMLEREGGRKQRRVDVCEKCAGKALWNQREACPPLYAPLDDPSQYH